MHVVRGHGHFAQRFAIPPNANIDAAGSSVVAGPPASNVAIKYNDIEDSRFTGIRVDGDVFGCCFPTGPTNITVAHNHVARAGTLFPQDGIILNRTNSDTVLDNLVEASSRDGVAVRNSNSNVVSGNHSESNGRDGIRSRGTSSGNMFEGNHMTANAEHDATVAAFQLMAATGGLNAATLALDVKLYDPLEHYKRDASAWVGLGP